MRRAVALDKVVHRVIQAMNLVANGSSNALLRRFLLVIGGEIPGKHVRTPYRGVWQTPSHDVFPIRPSHHVRRPHPIGVRPCCLLDGQQFPTLEALPPAREILALRASEILSIPCGEAVPGPVNIRERCTTLASDSLIAHPLSIHGSGKLVSRKGPATPPRHAVSRGCGCGLAEESGDASAEAVKAKRSDRSMMTREGNNRKLRVAGGSESLAAMLYTRCRSLTLVDARLTSTATHCDATCGRRGSMCFSTSVLTPLTKGAL